MRISTRIPVASAPNMSGLLSGKNLKRKPGRLPGLKREQITGETVLPLPKINQGESGLGVKRKRLPPNEGLQSESLKLAEIAEASGLLSGQETSPENGKSQ